MKRLPYGIEGEPTHTGDTVVLWAIVSILLFLLAVSYAEAAVQLKSEFTKGVLKNGTAFVCEHPIKHRFIIEHCMFLTLERR